jgi:hypothetical protein
MGTRGSFLVNVGPSATVGSLCCTKEKWYTGRVGTLPRSCLGLVVLRREQRERLKSDHLRRDGTMEERHEQAQWK